ncbi:MAG: hypothetical protein EAZ28_02640 [Oscillatoriales cyanobacterium]|nr:MAG: hypothetical protein EAZ28_02640 [Oscillatoriales cyanobacterium]
MNVVLSQRQGRNVVEVVPEQPIRLRSRSKRRRWLNDLKGISNPET